VVLGLRGALIVNALLSGGILPQFDRRGISSFWGSLPLARTSGLSPWRRYASANSSMDLFNCM
jgi:hypothetical protein